MATRKRQLGFTLSETLAAIAVAGIGLSLAAPGLQSLASGNQRAAAVNQLVSTMHLARSEAVMRNRPVTVCTSSDGERCTSEPWERGWIAFLDSDGSGQRDPAEALLDHVAALPGMELTSAQFESFFVYSPNGRATGASREDNTAEFAFCEPAAERAARVVIVRANGLPSLSDNSRSGAPADCRTS